MKVHLSIEYSTQWGQTVYVYGSSPELGSWDKSKAIPMNCISPSMWTTDVNMGEVASLVTYRYLIKDGENIIRIESEDHHLSSLSKQNFHINDVWIDEPCQKFLYTSGFINSFFAKGEKTTINYYKNTILLKVRCPYVKKNQKLVLCGASDFLGNWDGEKALHFEKYDNGEWQVTIDSDKIEFDTEFKFAIYDNTLNQIANWDKGDNYILCKSDLEQNAVNVRLFIYNHEDIDWRAVGVSIPVFSLKSKDSFGIGDFYDLNKIIYWAATTGQKVVQILPINDTTSTHTWKDSYPYNAISIYALHPLYLGLKKYPLKNKAKYKRYIKEAEYLNDLDKVDYELVSKCKSAYIKELFDEIGEEILSEKKYQSFFLHNESWLFSYACFCYLRDKYQSAETKKWGKYSKYNRSELDALAKEAGVQKYIQSIYFIQYLLHKQLTEVKKYAHRHGVILKGDIPIGISGNSVDAWTEPHLFNLDVQTGAPPDDFSEDGQNWGFPTYNWNEMAKDDYAWWAKRFQKMADYFDAYRIDHILGFFRIWEIPQNAVQGLLGYFSPALPFSEEELKKFGFHFNEELMINPNISKNNLIDLFGNYTQQVIDSFLQPTSSERYELKGEYDNQKTIECLFAEKGDDVSVCIRDGLYQLCSEVLFIRDKYNKSLFHPRISAQKSYLYKDLDDSNREAFDSLYANFFYHRHSKFWQDNAMKKLPSLISSTHMLVCGEDLGMIPECVPSVMKDLQILSLEIERMPKEFGRLFSNLSASPYLSVCTTSTHDMSPIRAWWHENENMIQLYYNKVLWKPEVAPNDCSSDLCRQILKNHLNSPSILTILPLQDWLSISDKYKNIDPENERINIPAIPNFYWQYRMHLNLEDLLNAVELNDEIESMIKLSNRH